MKHSKWTTFSNQSLSVGQPVHQSTLPRPFFLSILMLFIVLQLFRKVDLLFYGSVKPGQCPYFPQKLTTALLESAEGGNNHGNYFIKKISMNDMWPDSGSNSRPLDSQPTMYRGQLIHKDNAIVANVLSLLHVTYFYILCFQKQRLFHQPVNFRLRHKKSKDIHPLL